MANLNYFPVTSPEWLQQKMDIIEPLLRKRLTEIASSRGLDVNDPLVQKQIEDEIDRYRQQYMAEQSQYAFQESENEKTRQSQEKMAEKQAKSAENAALWSGLGQLGTYALFMPSNVGKDTLFSKISKPIGDFFKPEQQVINTVETKPLYSSVDKLSTSPLRYELSPTTQTINRWSDLQKIGIPAAGAIGGYLLNPTKGGTWSSLIGGASGLIGSKYGNFNPYSGLGTFLGSLTAPKQGLFSKSSNFWKSLLSLGLSTSPLWL